MAAILPHNLRDVILAYHRSILTDGKVVKLDQDYRNYYFSKVEDKMQSKTKASKSFHLPLLINGYSNFTLDSLFNPESVNRQDLGDQASVTWSIMKTHYVVDKREPGWQDGASPAQIYNHLDLQMTNMMTKLYDEYERLIWTLPAYPNDGSAGNPAPWGIPYHIRQSATAAVGPNGTSATGYTGSWAGLDRTTEGKLANYTAVSSSMSHADFVDKGSEMLAKMSWKPPRPDANAATFNPRFELVSGYAALKAYQDLCKASNEDIGPDMAKYRSTGSGIFHGHVWTWSDALTSSTLPDGTSNPAYDSNGPCYFVDWNSMVLFGAEGWYNRLGEPMDLDSPHNVVVTWLDSIWNLMCLNPRCNGVIRTGLV